MKHYGLMTVAMVATIAFNWSDPGVSNDTLGHLIYNAALGIVGAVTTGLIYDLITDALNKKKQEKPC